MTVLIEKAQANQTFFGVPERTSVTQITVNGGAPVTFVNTPAGVSLDVPVAQDDIVAITYEPVIG